MYAAYDTLSETMRRIVGQLRVVNDAALNMLHGFVSAEALAKRKRDNPPVVQDMVRMHPETGKKALYLNRLKTSHIDGMTVEESRPLLQYLFDHSERPQFVYRHNWRVFDLVMWDNRCTMHRALPDFDPDEDRELCRTTLQGEQTGALYQGSSAAT